ncbi:unnamed protein product [Enterobius vermicularis]|uniref:PABS domain-containing protein n=1 Tax=Enterobius vermicularis TaxID=51028 RepID=A0A158QAP0_ENTVE|nr:unnamed protein product [Enterobius vermicularis]
MIFLLTLLVHPVLSGNASLVDVIKEQNQENPDLQMIVDIKNITTFPTSLANLSVFDIILNYPSLKKALIIIIAEGFDYTKNDTRRLKVDHSVVHFGLRSLLAAPFAIGSLSTSLNSTSNVLIMNITVVELEKTMVEVAHKYFGLVDDDHQKTIVMDGVKYIENASKNGEKYDVVIIDACPTIYPMEKVILCPSTTFITNDTIRNIREVLSKNGVVIFKMLMVTDDVETKAHKIARRFINYKLNCAVIKMMHEFNRVLVCANAGIPKSHMEPSYIANKSLVVYREVGF